MACKVKTMFYTSQENWEKVREMGKERDRSGSYLIDLALTQFLEREEEKKKNG